MPRYRDDPWIPAVAEALESEFRVGALKKLAGLLSTAPLPTRKGELVALVAQHLEGDSLRAVWQRLDELQRAAVAEAVHAPGGRFHGQRFRAKYGRDPDWGSLNEYDRAAKPSLLHLFLYRGVVPDDLRERLRAFVPEPSRALLEASEELPAAFDRPFVRYDPDTRTRERRTEPVPLTVRETERAAQRDLHTVLRLVADGKVQVSDKTRRPGAAATKAVAAALDGGDFYPSEPAFRERDEEEAAGPIKAFAWPLVVQAAGLAELAGSRLRLTRAGTKALTDPPAPTLRTAWSRWLGTTLIDELARVDCIKGQTGKGKRGLTAVAGRRDALADALAECPVGLWVATDELFRFMRAAGHDFEVTRDAWGLYVTDPHYGSLGYDGYGGWEILQARYALCLLFEYTATLGLVDVAYVRPVGARPDYRELWGTDGLAFFSRYDGLTHIRLTPLGAYCLGSAEEYEPAALEARPALRVLPNLDLVATGEELAFGDRLELERYAERISDRVWRLSPRTLLTALEQGGSIAELREFLSARNAGPLPEAATLLLDDIDGRGERLRDRGAARLIECDDPGLAALILNDARTGGLCLPAGDRHLVVPAASERAFRRALRELGYPLATGERLQAAA